LCCVIRATQREVRRQTGGGNIHSERFRKASCLAFLGENSAVKYTLRCEHIPDGRTGSVLNLDQLLCKQDDGTYSTIKDVKVALRGYADFERSFDIPEGKEASPKEVLSFKDDLLAGESRRAVWEG